MFEWLKKKQPEEGMTSDEYADMISLCISWFNIERGLIDTSEDPKAIEHSAYYNMAGFNLFKLTDVDAVFKVEAHQFTLIRLSQLYLNVCFRFGRKRINSWKLMLQESIVELSGLDEKYVASIFHAYPYLVLIPMLNIVMSSQSVSPRD